MGGLENNIGQLLTIDETAELLGVSTTAIRRLQYNRQLSFYKVGGSVRFSTKDLLEFLENHKVEALDLRRRN